MKIRIGSALNKRLGYRRWGYDNPMASIPANNTQGQVIGLEVLPAADGSGAYVPVVHLENADDVSIDIGTVNQGDPGSRPWKVDPPDVISPVAIATMPAVSIDSMPAITLGTLPAGTNPIGGVYQTPTASASFAITPGSSPSLENQRILKGSAGNLYSVYVLTGSVGGFLMTFNSTSVPADGPVTPIECIPVGPRGIVGIGVDGSPPDHYSSGIVVVFSTTGPFVKTTASGYGMGPYGRGPYSTPALAFFKWSIQ